ncbi:MAG TPA: CHASE2 domain-containing protein [Methylomirabilota bacterium]
MADDSIAASEGPSPSTRTLVQFVFLAALGALLFNFHGISLHLTPWSQAIVNAIVKYTYDATGQQKTLVVLFREENLATLRESFPISYARHAEVLEALAVYEPAAVFVDFAFIDKRPGQDVAPLSEAICALRASGVAVYLAASPLPGKAGGDGLRDGLDRSCFTPVDVQMDTEIGASGVLTYRACKNLATSCEPAGLLWTPAFAMAAPQVGLARADGQQMEIIWGNRVSALNESWMDCTSDGTLVHLRQMLKENPLASKRKCPHTNTISVIHLLGRFDQTLKDRVVKGNTVFYGGSFEMAGDRVISPVFDDLPGVYLHAMAYDNLLTFRKDYKRAEQHGLSLSRVVNGLLLLFTIVLLLLVDKPPAFARRLLGRLGTVSPRVKWATLAVAVTCVALTAVTRTSVLAILLLVPLLLGVVAVLHLAATHPERRPSARQFLWSGFLGATILLGAILLFLGVDARYGIEAALLLVVLPGYFVYKALVARDVLFVATTVLLIGAAVVSFLPPINLGPRNIVAYVAFFELARAFMRRADAAARRYFTLRAEQPDPASWGVSAGILTAMDWIFALCIRGDDEEVFHEATARTVA